MTIIDVIPLFAGVTSLILLRRVSSPTNMFNPFVYFFWMYFIFCFVAVFYRGLYDYAIEISDDTILFLSLGMVFLSLGGVLASFARQRALTHKTLEELIYQAVNSVSTRSFLVYFVVFIPILISIVFTWRVGKFLWLSESFDDERVVVRQGIGWISIIGIASAYVAVIYSSIHFYRKRAYFRLSLVTLLLSICAISYGNRAPGFEVVVIGGLFLWVGLFGKFKFSHFAMAFFSALALVMVLGVVRQGLDFNFESVYRQMLWRPFVNIQNLEWVVSFIPSQHDYFYGESMLIDLSVLLPGYQPNFGTYMKELMGKEFTGGSITVSFLGQLYADFGFLFSLLVIFIFGFVLQRIFLVFSSIGRWLPVLILFAITTKSMASSGIVSPIIYILIPCGIFLVIWLLVKSVSRMARTQLNVGSYKKGGCFHVG